MQLIKDVKWFLFSWCGNWGSRSGHADRLQIFFTLGQYEIHQFFLGEMLLFEYRDESKNDHVGHPTDVSAEHLFDLMWSGFPAIDFVNRQEDLKHLFDIELVQHFFAGIIDAGQ